MEKEPYFYIEFPRDSGHVVIAYEKDFEIFDQIQSIIDNHNEQITQEEKSKLMQLMNSLGYGNENECK